MDISIMIEGQEGVNWARWRRLAAEVEQLADGEVVVEVRLLGQEAHALPGGAARHLAG